LEQSTSPNGGAAPPAGAIDGPGLP
jgi:hypothetical protein